ncbi:MAG: hypothetical protein ACI8U4_001389 [Natronomonas sp.]|jgi:hypothetical protein
MYLLQKGGLFLLTALVVGVVLLMISYLGTTL